MDEQTRKLESAWKIHIKLNYVIRSDCCQQNDTGIHVNCTGANWRDKSWKKKKKRLDSFFKTGSLLHWWTLWAYWCHSAHKQSHVVSFPGQLLVESTASLKCNSSKTKEWKQIIFLGHKVWRDERFGLYLIWKIITAVLVWEMSTELKPRLWEGLKSRKPSGLPQDFQEFQLLCNRCFSL